MKTRKRFVITDMFKHHNILVFFLTLAITLTGLSGLISTPSHAELIDNGDGLIYDTVLDITWGQPDNSTATWDDANTWAAGLNLGGVGGWRLPYISVAAGAGPFTEIPGCEPGSTLDCTDNELGYMFYENLGFEPGMPTPPNGDPEALALFRNLTADGPYWSSTEWDSANAWSFASSGSGSLAGDKGFLRFRWAVHEGNVGGTEPPGDLPPKVITDVNGNVTRIENLLVLDEIGVTKLYNVDFDYDSAINVYTAGEFDFPASADALAASLAVRDALNAEDTIPPGAGPQGSDQFFIGWTERFGLVLAVGSEILVGFWDDCETDCLGGVAVLDPDELFTYAKFTETQDVPPGPATLISPSGAIIENNPTYTWNAVADSSWYNLIVKDDTEEVIIDEWYTAESAGCGVGTGECSVTPAEVLADGLYQWLIQTYNENGEGPESDEMFFTVDTTGVPPEPATLISPSGDISDNTPTYTWDAVANAAQYQLFVWDSTETEIINQWYTAEEAGCSDTTVQCSLTPETVLADDAHEWWIRTWNGNGKGPWSAKLSFTVDTSAPPEPATLISPSGDITDNTPTYTWNAVADSTWYRLFVWDSTKTEIIDQWYTAEEVGCVDGAGQCSVTPVDVLADDSHEWWIRTWNKPGGDGDWSEELSFTVDTSSAPSVELDEDDNVIRITNLPVSDENGTDITIYDVDFTYGTVTDVYGDGLRPKFDFPAPENDVNIYIALEAVIDALNGNDPIPVGAGPQGTDQYFIGYKVHQNGYTVAAEGKIVEDVWGEESPTVLHPYDSFTWADFTVAE